MVSHTSALRNLLGKLLYLQESSSMEVKESCTMVLNYSSGSLGEDAIIEVHWSLDAWKSSRPMKLPKREVLSPCHQWHEESQFDSRTTSMLHEKVMGLPCEWGKMTRICTMHKCTSSFMEISWENVRAWIGFLSCEWGKMMRICTVHKCTSSFMEISWENVRA